MRPLLALLVLQACTAGGIERATQHFDPPSGTALLDTQASISIVGLDGLAVCYSLDGDDPGFGQSCKARLGDASTLDLGCGFHAIVIRWGEGSKYQEANYLVEGPSCADTNDTEMAPIWQNDELVRAFVAIKDDLQCRMNGCKNPSLPGSWSAKCGDGTVSWRVEVQGLRALSTFTYSGCRATATIEVHDPMDVAWQDPQATVPLNVELILDGTFHQDTDFSGNGAEEGSVAVSGDFEGTLTSLITIANKARGGGSFAASCVRGPIENEICAPGSATMGASIRYDYPEWTCHGDVCPVP